MLNKTLSLILGQQPTTDILSRGLCHETIHAIGLIGCVFASIVFIVLINVCREGRK